MLFLQVVGRALATYLKPSTTFSRTSRVHSWHSHAGIIGVGPAVVGKVGVAVGGEDVGSVEVGDAVGTEVITAGASVVGALVGAGD